MNDYFDYRFALVDYSEKSFVLVLEFEGCLTTQLQELGGRFNSRLTCGPGWVFSKARHMDDVLEILDWCEMPERWITPGEVREAAQAAGVLKLSKHTNNNSEGKQTKSGNTGEIPDYILTDTERRQYWKQCFPDYSEKDLKWYFTQYPVIVRLAGGECVPIESGELKTTFLFGESDFQGPTSEEAEAAAAAARSEEYFTEENLYEYKDFIAALESPAKYAEKAKGIYNYLWLANWRDDKNEWRIQWNSIDPETVNAREALRHRDSRLLDMYDKGRYRALSEDDRKRLVTAYRIALEKREKRCRTWLKRYGVEKLNISTYWMDR